MPDASGMKSSQQEHNTRKVKGISYVHDDEKTDAILIETGNKPKIRRKGALRILSHVQKTFYLY